MLRKLCCLALLFLAPTAARSDAPFAFEAGTAAKAAEVNANFAYLEGLLPAVYWAVSPTYDRGVEVTATSTTTISTWEELNISVASLTLPAGSYLASAKIVAWSASTWADLQCALATSDGTQADWSSIDANGGEKVLTMQVPLTLTVETTIRFVCHLCGTASSGSATATLWGAKLYAVRAASVTMQ